MVFSQRTPLRGRAPLVYVDAPCDDNDDVGFVSDDKAFQNVNDAEGSNAFIIDEDSKENDIFGSSADDDDDSGFYDDLNDESIGSDDLGFDFATSEDDYE